MNKPDTVYEFFKNNPSCWTQGASARDKDGEPVDYNSIHAHKWCLLGAISKVVDGEAYQETLKINKIWDIIYAESISIWNDEDNRTVEEVIDLAKRAGI